MIKIGVLGHPRIGSRPPAASLTVLTSYPSAVAPPKVHSDEARLRRVLAEHFDVTWRLLRRLGVPEREIDDAIQEVILVLSRKLECVEPERERSFVLGTAHRVASTFRRTLRRRREVDPEPIAALPDDGGTPESLLEQRRARALLDSALDALSPDLRAVFVFYELERLTMAEIAETLGLPPGTVASRLRRARSAFASQVALIEQQIKKGEP